MRTTHRIYKTSEGELVREGHPEAAYLVYGDGDEVENRDQATVEALLEPAQPEPGKSAAKRADKAAAKPTNKQASKPADK